MRKLRYLIIFLSIISLCFAEEYATTNSGKIVLLKGNGTWVYIERLPAKVIKIVDGDTIKLYHNCGEAGVIHALESIKKNGLRRQHEVG